MTVDQQTSQVRTFARGMVVVVGATFFGLGTNYIYGIYLARQLGAETFGLYSIGLTIFNVLAMLSVMGLDSAIMHFVPGAVAEGSRRRALSVVRRALKIVAAASLSIAAVLFIMSEYLATDVFAKPGLAPALLFFALAIPAYAGSAVLLSSLQAFHDVNWRTLVKFVSEPVTKFLLTAVLLFTGLGLYGALTGFLVAFWLSVFLGWLGLRYKIKKFSSNPRGEAKADVTSVAIVGFSAPLLAGMVFNAIASRSDILILGYHLQATDVGIYAAALQTAAIVVIVMQAVDSIMSAPLSEALSRGDNERARDIYRLSLRWALIVGSPLLLMFSMFAGSILGFFGDTFESGATALVILAVAQFVIIATGSANCMLVLAGRSRLVMLNEGLNGVILVCLNLALIPQFGIVGAAVAVLVSVTALNILRLAQVHHLLKLQPYHWALAKPLIAALATYLVSSFLLGWVPSNEAIWFIPFVFILYLGLLFALGLHDQDREALRSVIPVSWRISVRGPTL